MNHTRSYPCLGGALLAAILLKACSETACSECMEEECADLITRCDHPDCECMVSCLGDSGVPGVEGCLEQCGLEERPAAFALVESCVVLACRDSDDECSTPAEWTPAAGATDSGPGGDIGGGDLPHCGFDDELPFDADGPVLQMESDDGSVCVRLERLSRGDGGLANTRWVLLEMSVGPLGQVAHVEDAGDLCWYSSLHNFRDFAHVWTGTRRHSLGLLQDGPRGPRRYMLHTFERGPLGGSCAPDADGDRPIGAPIELFPLNEGD